jgi:HPt (histidine-containing phosphotransfer) domain-containing protein
MKQPVQPEPAANADLNQAIDRLWVRFLPEMRERVSILAAAAAALADGTLTAAQCEAAQAAAHKLAGVLGTFNLTRGTDLARKLEISFSQKGGPDRDAADRLAAAAHELQIVIENRKPAA